MQMSFSLSWFLKRKTIFFIYKHVPTKWKQLRPCSLYVLNNVFGRDSWVCSYTHSVILIICNVIWFLMILTNLDLFALMKLSARAQIVKFNLENGETYWPTPWHQRARIRPIRASRKNNGVAISTAFPCLYRSSAVAKHLTSFWTIIIITCCKHSKAFLSPFF